VISVNISVNVTIISGSNTDEHCEISGSLSGGHEDNILL
jgi:hypothetical protein